ncbi:MAG: TrmH family RNA methyltransferase [Pseudorhodoplanes sp.]|jgi:tRNA/rRNA methyltransferase|nr:TrmH family RNA methyltransferase [Pseudorhodoplanes sp.]
MPGAGTDKTKDWAARPAPIVILVEPQLGENIGAVARAMGNFGLSRLRLVKPVQGWPNERARVMAAGADRILEQAELFDGVEAAIADCHYVLGATARMHDQAKPVVGADAAARLMAPRIAGGETVALMFGRERNGLENDEVGMADAILTLPVNPAFASLNLGQAVVVVGYEWFKLANEGGLPFGMPQKSPPAPKEQLFAFFRDLESELEQIEYFRPAEKRDTMIINMRNIFTRMQPTQQDIRTLHGIITSLVQGRKGPARGGVLDGTQAELLRGLLSGQANLPEGATAHAPMRGLARLLRRNPTDAERIFWRALTNDRRFAASGFKRQTPVGPHIVDFVSFPLRAVIDLVPVQESGEAESAREERRAWLAERDYKVIKIAAGDVEKDVAAVLDALASTLSKTDPLA